MITHPTRNRETYEKKRSIIPGFIREKSSIWDIAHGLLHKADRANSTVLRSLDQTSTKNNPE